MKKIQPVTQPNSPSRAKASSRPNLGNAGAPYSGRQGGGHPAQYTNRPPQGEKRSIVQDEGQTDKPSFLNRFLPTFLKKTSHLGRDQQSQNKSQSGNLSPDVRARTWPESASSTQTHNQLNGKGKGSVDPSPDSATGQVAQKGGRQGSPEDFRIDLDLKHQGKSSPASQEIRKALEQEPLSQRKASLQAELGRVRYEERYRKALKSTFFSLVVVAAIAVLVATLWLPVLQVYGNSMNPTLENGDVLVSLRNGKYKTGEIIAFYYNNKILIKRVIGNPGDLIDIDDEGNVILNRKPLEEPYVFEKALGDCDIELPFQVPEGRIFVMGDHRSTSVDSRREAVGCIADEQIVGRLIYRLWPLKEAGPIE